MLIHSNIKFRSNQTISSKSIYTLMVFLLSTSFTFGQIVSEGLVAKYSFSGNANDEVGNNNGIVVGATLTEDRFGNPNSAYYFYGTPMCYINLGTGSELKQLTGSICLWAKVDSGITSGAGYSYDPMILTKNQTGNDYFEAYCIYYNYVNEKVLTITTYPPSNEKVNYTDDAIQLNTWNFYVLTFDFDSSKLYLNGILQSSMYRGFNSIYLAGDSVMLGYSANTQNCRYFNGVIDDIRFYKGALTSLQIDSLYDEAIPTGISPDPVTTCKAEIFPNPFSSLATIKFSTSLNNASIIIHDLYGQVIRVVPKFSGDKTVITRGNLSNGVYLIEFREENKTISAGKLVIVD